MSTIKVNAIQTTSSKPILNSTGSILQVVQTIKTNNFSTTTAGSDTWVDITGLSASITPSSTNSKILIFTEIQGGGLGTYYTLCSFRWTRNSSTLTGALGDTRAGWFRATAGFQRASFDSNSSFRCNMTYLDSPGSTALQTYQVQGQAESSGFVINRTANDNGSQVYSATAASSITLLEVSA
jgi:hypothetical protein